MRRICVGFSLLSPTIFHAQQALGTGGQSRSVAEQPPAGWSDRSTHRVQFLNSGGVKLQYLDWGGRGPLMIWLPGFRSSAHIFDDLAPRFADKFHVVALTPRGHGESDAPDDAQYSLMALEGDLRALFDTLKADRAFLVGHSLAGAVMTQFAARYPERVLGLAYLDANGRPTGLDSIAARQPRRAPPTNPEVLKRPDGLRAFAAATSYGQWSNAAEADFQARPVGDEGARRNKLLAPLMQEFVSSRADYVPLKSPVLAICVVSGPKSDFAWVKDDPGAGESMMSFLRDVQNPFQRRECQQLQREAPQAQTTEIESWHYVFLAAPDHVEQLMRTFLQAKVLKQ